MDNRASSAPKPVQVILASINIIVTELISIAWELTELEFLTGVPISVLLNQTSAATNLSLANIPKPDPRTSEDCLFLDVFTPKSVFDSRDKRNDDNHGGEFSGSLNAARALKIISPGPGLDIWRWLYRW
jgi:hypothetical protein